MKVLIKNELKRAVFNKWMYISLLIGCSLAIIHVIANVIPYANRIYLGSYPLTVFNKWMGGESFSVEPVIYFFIFPILISLPYAGTLKMDISSGYIKNIITRINKTKYFLTKYVITFITSSILAVIPLILNLLLVSIILPSTIPQANLGTYPIFSVSLMGDLYYSKPYLYILIYLIIIGIFSGLLSTTALFITYFAENIFFVILSPFIIYLLAFSITQLTDLHQFSPYGFLRPSQPIPGDWFVIMVECVILIIIGGLYMYVSSREKIY